MNHQINRSLDLQNFYPSEMDISQIIEKKDEIHLKVFVRTISCRCPHCNTKSVHHHGTYTRTIQDLPIFGKTTKLLVNSYEYQCDNPECPTVTFADNIHGFLSYYSRMTDRCTDFICSLALETSCEGAARICRETGIKISGDTIIRILKKRFDEQSAIPAETSIGVDDFSTKKGSTYCTIICNGDSHKPIAVLDGRDGRSLREWLKNNKHVKCVTRDRASSYAKVINEELPDAIQVTDRFHLHQNLLEAVKKALASEKIPQTIRIEQEISSDEKSLIKDEDNVMGTEPCKKNRTCCG